MLMVSAIVSFAATARSVLPDAVPSGAIRKNPVAANWAIRSGVNSDESCRTIPHFVPRQLFANELIERFVLVEAVDDVIAIKVSELALDILIRVPVRISVAGDIQPMASPTFAVMGRSQ